MVMGLPPCDMCCDISKNVVCRGDAFLEDLIREKRLPVSESHACTSLILLIIKMDVSLIAGFPPSACMAQPHRGSRAGISCSVSPGMGQVRNKLSFFI